MDAFISPLRQLPHSAEAEIALVGSVIVNNKAYWACGDLRPHHFATLEGRLAWAALSAVIEAGRVADAITLSETLDPDEFTAGVPPLEYLQRAVDCAQPAQAASTYADIIRSTYSRRRLIQLADEAVQRALSPDLVGDPAQIASDLSAGIDDIAPRKQTCATWRMGDPRRIQPRQWLLGNMMVRGEVCGIGGSGGRGKTTLALLASASLATGRPLIGVAPPRPLRVLYLHMEEPDIEFDRRLSAIALHYRLSPDDFGDRLVHRGGGLRIVHVDEAGAVVGYPDSGELRQAVRLHRPDVVFADPFKMTYSGQENSNDAINVVVREWKKLAEKYSCAVAIVHHFRKGPVTPGDPDGFRGAGAFVDACRTAYTVASLKEEDADRYGLDERERRRIVRMDDAKANMSLRGDPAMYRLESVPLGNGDDDYPGGDHVQVARSWQPPDALDGISVELARKIVIAIDEGLDDGRRYSPDRRGRLNERWAGTVVMSMAALDDEDAAQRILNAWLASGLLEVRECGRHRSKPVSGLFCNLSKLPG